MGAFALIQQDISIFSWLLELLLTHRYTSIKFLPITKVLLKLPFILPVTELCEKKRNFFEVCSTHPTFLGLLLGQEEVCGLKYILGLEFPRNVCWWIQSLDMPPPETPGHLNFRKMVQIPVPLRAKLCSNALHKCWIWRSGFFFKKQNQQKLRLSTNWPSLKPRHSKHFLLRHLPA